jgi:hypothetical protein
VSVTHPFTGKPQFNGYDVRGVFMGGAHSTMNYSTKLKYPKYGTDQYQLNDPVNGDGGGPDGYTRWYNAVEFKVPGLFGYTPGIIGSAGYTPNGTVNPYQYYADGIGVKENAFDFLTDHSASNGVFASGKKNTRNYYLEFPLPLPGAKYGYAVVANWESATVHPSNAPEALALSLGITPEIYYFDDTDKGGNFNLDIDVWGWNYQPSAMMLESDILSGLYTFDATDMTPIGGGEHYSTYHVEVPADNITHNTSTGGDADLWIVCECPPGFDYKCEYTPPGGAAAPTATLAAFFRYPVYIRWKAYNKPPVINSGVNGEEKPIEWTVETYNVDATDPDGDPMTYSWTVTDGNGDPVEGYDGVPGDGAGNLDVDWGEVAGWTQGVTPFTIDCVVSDPLHDTPASTLAVEVWVDGDLWVSNHPDFGAVPDNGTQAEPYSTIAQATTAHAAGDTIVVDYGTGTYNERIYLYWSTGCTIRAWSWYTTPAGRPTITNSLLTHLVYCYYTNNVTVQGFKLQIYTGTGSGGYQPVYVYYSSYFTLRDCSLTGTISYYYLYALYCYGPNMTIENCKFSDLQTNYPAYTYAYIYFYIYNPAGIASGACKFNRNEFTKLQDTIQVPGYMYLYFYIYYWPNGSQVNNNLFHHISPNVLTYAYLWPFRVYYPYATATVANNVVDKIDVDKGTDSSSSTIYGMYLYNGGSVTYGYDGNSNIVSNITGSKTLPYYYGEYDYNTSTDYDDVWNIQDTAYGSAVAGPHSISANPLFVNNTTPPYDYHLDTGSPCIGTGKSGVDMGCYGNLPAGAVVGLLTPE